MNRRTLTATQAEQHALTMALVLAVTAPTEDGCRRAVHLAGSIAAGLRRIDVQMCQLDAKRRLDRM